MAKQRPEVWTCREWKLRDAVTGQPFSRFSVADSTGLEVAFRTNRRAAVCRAIEVAAGRGVAVEIHNGPPVIMDAVMGQPVLKLFVWREFAPDYKNGVAVAIAEDIAEAMELVLAAVGHDVTEWGPVEELPVQPAAFAATGGQ